MTFQLGGPEESDNHSSDEDFIRKKKKSQVKYTFVYDLFIMTNHMYSTYRGVKKYSGFLSQRISLNILFVFAYEIEIRNPQDCICRQCHKIFKIFKAEIYKFFSELSKTRRVKRSPWMPVQASGMVAVHVKNCIVTALYSMYILYEYVWLNIIF